MELLPFRPCQNLRVSADVARVGDRVEFSYAIGGDTADVVVPPPALAERSDGLWQSTCFEAFVGLGGSRYVELNFAPSGRWAAYRFEDYREGMQELDIAAPVIRFSDDRLVATVELPAEPGAALGLTAVIERSDGSRSYWALAHPEGERPDFHVRDCFVAKLP